MCSCLLREREKRINKKIIVDVHARREECWAKLIRDRMLLPANTIKLYDPDGKLMARLIAYQTSLTISDEASHSPLSYTDPPEKGSPNESGQTHGTLSHLQLT